MKSLAFALAGILFFLDSYGQNVGIGTVTPIDKLNIDSGGIRIGKSLWDNSIPSKLLKFGDGDYITIGEDEVDDRLLIKAKNIIFKPSSAGYNGYVGINTNYFPNSPLEIFSTSQSPSQLPGLRITSIGSNTMTSWNIYNYYGGPGTTSLWFASDGVDKAYIDYAGVYHQVSDRRLKKNIDYMVSNNILSKIISLKPAFYQMQNDDNGSSKQTGFISQDVENVFPELISDIKGIKMMNYTGLIPILTKGMQEQQQQIEALSKRIEQLENQLSKNK